MVEHLLLGGRIRDGRPQRRHFAGWNRRQLGLVWLCAQCHATAAATAPFHSSLINQTRGAFQLGSIQYSSTLVGELHQD